MSAHTTAEPLKVSRRRGQGAGDPGRRERHKLRDPRSGAAASAGTPAARAVSDGALRPRDPGRRARQFGCTAAPAPQKR